jgi:Fic family protein
MDAVDRAQRLKGLQAKYIQKVRTARASALLTRLVEELFNQPMVTMGKVADLLDVTPNTAQKHIDRLILNGILREVTGRKRNRIYVAEGIIKSIYEPDYRRADLKVGKE